MGRSGKRISRLRAERGAITAGLVVALVLAVVAGYILLGFAGGDHDRHGRVAVPGISILELPGGESKIYFVQGAASTATEAPADLLIVVRAPGVEVVEVDPRGAEADVRDGESVRLIGSINPPREGEYEVRVASEELAGRISPQISFGQSSFGAIRERLDSILDALLGPLGLLLLVLLAAIWFVPRLKLAITRSRE